MKVPKLRVSVRAMMVAVAILALAILGGREIWTWWLRRGYRNPIYQSQLSVIPGVKNNGPLIPGCPIPIAITYKFKFSPPKPKSGTTCLLYASVWFEDAETGFYVDGYSFDSLLTAGDRESASGTFIWDAAIPRPGRYILRDLLYYGLPGDVLKITSGGGGPIRFVEASGKPPDGDAR